MTAHRLLQGRPPKALRWPVSPRYSWGSQTNSFSSLPEGVSPHCSPAPGKSSSERNYTRERQSRGRRSFSANILISIIHWAASPGWPHTWTFILKVATKSTFESVLMRWINPESIIEWSQSEREKRMSHIKAYTWTLERWCWRTYLQEGEQDERRERRGDVYTITCKPQPVGICPMTQRTQLGALWQPRGTGWSGRRKGGFRGSGHVYTYGWFTLMYGRNQHNIVKQLSFNNFLKSGY